MTEIVKKGFLTIPVSAKRHLLERFGVPCGGPADRILYTLANRLVGNPDDACALEATMVLPEIRFHEDGAIAVAGGLYRLLLRRGSETVAVPVNATVPVRAKDELLSVPIVRGMRAYLAILGGIRCDALRAEGVSDGQMLLTDGGRPSVLRSANALPIRIPNDEVELRVIAGVQQELFSKEGEAVFYGSAYTYTPDSSRMGIRLSGPAVAYSDGCDGNILSEGMLPGDVQIPPSGQPILMLADCPATGGYAKIAHVIAADLPLAAQLRPGARIRFRQTDVAWAHVALRRLLLQLDACVTDRT